MTIAATSAMQSSSSSASRSQTTRKDRIIYWTTTGIVSAVMVFSIINFTFLQGVPFPEGGFVHLHLPNYFRIELTIAKTLGVLALLIPSVPTKIKEFAYFGFGLNPKLRHGFTQDDKVLGSTIVGFGHSSAKGGTNVAIGQWWASMTKATVTIGGENVMEDGKLLVKS